MKTATLRMRGALPCGPRLLIGCIRFQSSPIHK